MMYYATVSNMFGAFVCIAYSLFLERHAQDNIMFTQRIVMTYQPV